MALLRLCPRNPFLHKSLLGPLSSSSSQSLSSPLLHAQRFPAYPRLLPLRGKLSFTGLAAAHSTSTASDSQRQQGKTEETSRRELTVSDDVSENSRRWKRGGGGRRRSLWRSPGDLIPFGGLFTPEGIGRALWQTTENFNRLLRNLSPSHFFRRMKEDENAYRLQFEVPGLSKEDLKVRVEDNFLVITGERKEEEEGGSDEEDYWSSRRYGYYNTTLMLPEDAKVGDVKAEVKHGVLYVTIPRTGEKKKDVREVEVH